MNVAFVFVEYMITGYPRRKDFEDCLQLFLSKWVTGFLGAVARAVVTEVENPKKPATSGSTYLDSVFDYKVNRHVDCGPYRE